MFRLPDGDDVSFQSGLLFIGQPVSLMIVANSCPLPSRISSASVSGGSPILCGRPKSTLLAIDSFGRVALATELEHVLQSVAVG